MTLSQQSVRKNQKPRGEQRSGRRASNGRETMTRISTLAPVPTRLNRSSFPLVPAKAGTQGLRTPALAALDARFRGHERNMVLVLALLAALLAAFLPSAAMAE